MPESTSSIPGPKKKPRVFPPGAVFTLTLCSEAFEGQACGELHRLHFVGLQALLALHNLERDLLAFLQRLEAAALDRTEVDEQVRAAFRGDEAEALGVVEPLNGSGLTIRHFCYSLKRGFDVHGRIHTMRTGLSSKG